MLSNISASVWGDQIIVPEAPRTEGYQNAHLLPLHDFPDRDPRWGTYDSDGRLIEQAAYKRGPGRQLLGQSQSMEADLEFLYVDAMGIYGGLNLPYYGHYLLSTLPRYWYDLKRSYPGSKIYIHVMEGLAHWFSRPFVLQTMTALGLTLDDFVAIDRPLRIRTLVVPGPAFIEQSQAHAVFSDTGRMIGEALLKKPVPARSEPVYLSKENLKSGIWKTTNESELVGEMRQAGVRIVHPENLELNEQVKIFAEHHTILGFAGSGLHTCLLSGGDHRIIALCPLASVNSNFLLLDRIKNNDSHYLGFPDGLLPAEKLPGFGDVFEIPDVKATARRMLELAT
ncbi:glycosyltransferase family 61 protein [Methylobacterium gregans]|uniref:Glycosyltransferase 61 catalytic domain-containing protein n=1 Tax=Methylobacterium gregans TaxID=374424 RepID=A0AA37HPD1_9HYPH|nr:glycosyltransferase 61 family protein [Methylobacterium gregans]MDQ0521780.1 hypothetical protein [Methylobacterium gregans]GJD79209.1 hypothetical protein NBEOAGPD_2432 [Methylobacterium gregans]